MQFLYIFITICLILLILSGFLGLYFFKNHIKKTASLVISYSAFLVLMIILAMQNAIYLNVILMIMTTILVVFIANIAVLAAILKRI